MQSISFHRTTEVFLDIIMYLEKLENKKPHWIKWLTMCYAAENCQLLSHQL